MLKIQLTKQAKRFLVSIPQKHAKQILGKIDKIAENPESVAHIQLEGFPEYRRAKSGEYRFIFKIHEEVLYLHIVLIGKRNDDEIYRDFVRVAGHETLVIEEEEATNQAETLSEANELPLENLPPKAD
jgi:mRNA interferase RelE/StbE